MAENNENSYLCSMLIINRESTDPYFNIATEEFLVKTLEETCFMLWQNRPSVIIGKHQNPLREVNMDFLKRNQIPIIRRISGGGTVYHDLGNLNYSFIDMGKAESLVNFAKYSKPVLDLLQELKVDAQLVGKSDLKIAGKKFSGNASHVYRNKVLHHGTLLFNSDLDILNESIKIKENNINDKAVNSNRSVVTNIADHLTETMSLLDFKGHLVEHILHRFPNSQIINLSQEQESQIQELARAKYKSWEWNFGYSPKYDIDNRVDIDNKPIVFNVHVAKGFIQSISPSSPVPNDIETAIEYLIGKQHQQELIMSSLKTLFTSEILSIIKKILF